jgi:tetratricopeptide (TPR) repeat protein
VRLATTAVILGLIFAASVAHADPDSRELSQRAKAAFDAGDFMTAAKLLEEAYASKPWPVLLYNLGRAYQQAGSKARAVEAYQRYLEREPSSPDAGAVRESIRQLQEQIDRDRDLEAQARAAKERAAHDAEEANRARAAAREANERAKHRPSPGPWITVGVGLGGVAAGLVFGALAVSAHSAAVADPAAPQAVSDQSSAQTDATVANVLFIAGGTIAVVGVVWGIFDLRLAFARRVQVGVRPNGLSLGLAF